MSSTVSICLGVIDTICWVVCFWWMHRISTRQNAVLDELKKQAHRIEGLSSAEHDLVKEMHPKVEKIEEHVSDLAEAARADEILG